MGREEVRGYEKKIQNSIKSRTSVPRICMYGSWKVNKNGAKILAELNAWNSGQKFWTKILASMEFPGGLVVKDPMWSLP